MMTKATKIKMNMNMIIDNYEDDNYIVDQEGHIIYLFYEDEDDENNFEKEFNHVIDVNALVFELLWVFIQSTFQCASANLYPEGKLNALEFQAD